MDDLTYWQKRAVLAKIIMLGYVDAYKEGLTFLYEEVILDIDRIIAEWYGRFYDASAMNYQTAQFNLTSAELARFKRDIQSYIQDDENYSDEWRAELRRLLYATRVTRLEALEVYIYQRLEEIYAFEKSTLDELFRLQYIRMFYLTAYNWQERHNRFSTVSVDDNTVNETLETPWANDGMVYAERVWANKEKLKKELNTIISQGLILGIAYSKMAENVLNKLQSAESNAMTIVETEAAHFHQTAQSDLYSLYTVEKVQILATLDMKTCERCASLHGTIIDQKDNIPGVTTPQFHPNCRCTTVDYEITYRVPETDITQKGLIDGYYKWYERYVNGVAV